MDFIWTHSKIAYFKDYRKILSLWLPCVVTMCNPKTWCDAYCLANLAKDMLASQKKVVVAPKEENIYENKFQDF